MTLFNGFFSSVSVFDARSWEYHNALIFKNTNNLITDLSTKYNL